MMRGMPPHPPPPTNDDDADSAADAARARRRFELENLKRTTRRNNVDLHQNNFNGNRTEDLLAKARDQLLISSAQSSTSSLTSADHHHPPAPRMPRPPPTSLSTMRISSHGNSVNSDISNNIDNRQFQWQQQQQRGRRPPPPSNNRNRVYNYAKGGAPPGGTSQQKEPQPQQTPAPQTTPTVGGYPHRTPTTVQITRNLESTFDKKSTSTADAGAGVPPPPTPRTKEVPPKKPLLSSTNNTSSTSASMNTSTRARRPSPIIPILGDKKPNNSSLSSSSQQHRNNRRQHYSVYATTPTASSSPHEAELLNELKKVHQDKEDAFRQVVRLREQVQKLSVPPAEAAEEEFKRLVEKADREGESAALQWARQQVERSSSRKKTNTFGSRNNDTRRPMFGFPSPARSRRTSSPSRRALTPAIGPGLRKRTSTPNPRKRGGVSENSPELLALATRSNPDEYDSVVAIYKVRRPYAPHDEDTFWKDVGELSNEEYQATASVQTPSSLEVAAVIKADKSVLLVSHVSDCRHKKKKAKVWRTFDNVDERDQPLGSVMFIDTQANEGEYWLDEIFEEAMSTRDTYCSSLLSTVTALESNLVQTRLQQQQQPTIPPMAQTQQAAPSVVSQQQHPSMPPQMVQIVQQQPPQMITSAAVPPPISSSNIPPVIQQQQQAPSQQSQSLPPPLVPDQPPFVNENKTEAVEMENKEKPSGEIATTETIPAAQQEAPAKKKKSPPPPPPPEEANDLLSTMLGSLIYASVIVLYFLAVKVPLAIFKVGVYATIVTILYWIAWLRFAEYDPPSVLLGTNQVGVE